MTDRASPGSLRDDRAPPGSAGTREIEVALPAAQIERLARLEERGLDRDAVIAKALDAYLDDVERSLGKKR